jgi:hypothetical protein
MLPWQITGLTNNSYFDGAHEVAKVYNECHEGLFSLNPILCEILNICPENNLRAGLANDPAVPR